MNEWMNERVRITRSIIHFCCIFVLPQKYFENSRSNFPYLDTFCINRTYLQNIIIIWDPQINKPGDHPKVGKKMFLVTTDDTAATTTTRRDGAHGTIFA